MKRLISIAACLAAASFSTNAMAALVVKIELPGVTTTGGSPGVAQPVFDYVGMETFNNWATGSYNTPVTSNFNTPISGSIPANTQITGTYTGVRVINKDVYGGASNGADEKYAVVGLGQNSNSLRKYSIEFSNTGANGLNYFGFWLSALDGGNVVSFFSGDTMIESFNANAITSWLNSQTGSNYAAYMGNPISGGNAGEPYAFLNFYLEGGTFDRIEFSQAPGTAGYESDNHTVGYYKKQGGGDPIPAVPEPATWAMMLLGFGVVGGAMRSRRRNSRTTLSYT